VPQTLAEPKHAACGDHESDECRSYAAAIRPEKAGEAEELCDIAARRRDETGRECHGAILAR
jgi:hypothetical protein